MKQTIEIKLSGYGRTLAGRSTGKKIARYIGEVAVESKGVGLVLLNLDNMDAIDYPAAHEIITQTHDMKLSGRLKPRQRVAMMGGKENVVESMDAALKLSNRAALYYRNAAALTSSEWSVLGSIPPHLVETLRELYRLGEIDALRLSENLKIRVTACNNRLTELVVRGLVYRKSGNNGQRNVYLYGLGHAQTELKSKKSTKNLSANTNSRQELLKSARPGERGQ